MTFMRFMIVFIFFGLVGCSSKPVFVTTVTKIETIQNSQEDSFIKLVFYMRKHNRDVVTPEMELTAATYIKNAGMDWRCKASKRCYLVYKNIWVTISPEFIEIESDNGNRVVKIYNVENAARIIYSH